MRDNLYLPVTRAYDEASTGFWQNDNIPIYIAIVIQIMAKLDTSPLSFMSFFITDRSQRILPVDKAQRDLWVIWSRPVVDNAPNFRYNIKVCILVLTVMQKVSKIYLRASTFKVEAYLKNVVYSITLFLPGNRLTRWNCHPVNIRLRKVCLPNDNLYVSLDNLDASGWV